MRNGNCGYSWCSVVTAVFQFLSYLWGMETCISYICAIRYYLVLILPMRNGNFISFTPLFISFTSFLSYLWGMETPYLTPNNLLDQEFLSYLWGMETSFSLLSISALLKFLSYLWGMETLRIDQFLLHLSSSYPTYEEWKPPSKLKRSCTFS